MTILDALKSDHDEAKGLLKTILASKDGKKLFVGSSGTGAPSDGRDPTEPKK